MAKGTRVVRTLVKLPCPRCYAPMVGEVCESKGCKARRGKR